MAESIEELLQHASWLRGLAASLVSGETADDLVQETWQGPGHRPRPGGASPRSRRRSDRRSRRLRAGASRERASRRRGARAAPAGSRV